MHNIKISAEALRAASNWAMEGENVAPVELLAANGVLFVTQGDDRVAYDPGGTEVTLIDSPVSEALAIQAAAEADEEEEPVLNQHLLTQLEILKEALDRIAQPNRGARPTGRDAERMATFAQDALDRAGEA